MIHEWHITGDCHGDFGRFLYYDFAHNPEAGLIILGDAGFNFWRDHRDNNSKNKVTRNFAFSIYCVRGNHEARPQDIPDMVREYDNNVGGYVWYQSKWPNIKYFDDYGIYLLYSSKHKPTKQYFTLGVIGGAYSVDKDYRLKRKLPWFENEQLSASEMADCQRLFNGKYIDLMFTHTCPLDWEPRDLFLPQINQNTVDKTMEHFLRDLRDSLKRWSVWCFGHYHADRLERPRVEQFYKDTETLENIWDRWESWDKTQELDWWLTKSEQFYMT